jgi:methylated-DNA-[protein]-cysteine S-methyltransferase
MREELFELVKKIPKGKVTTYKKLAKELNTSPRAIGKLLNTNKELVIIPCHRVIKTNTELGGYKLGVKKKKELLKKEGVKIEKNKVSKKFLY